MIEKYEIPAAERTGLSHEDWLRKKRSLNAMQPGQSYRREIRNTSSKQNFGPTIKEDFEWVSENCPACIPKVRVIKGFQEYTKLLESIIRKKLGNEFLPKRPEELKDF